MRKFLKADTRSSSEIVLRRTQKGRENDIAAREVTGRNRRFSFGNTFSVKMRVKTALKPPLPPMEARSAENIPAGDGWQYEPKWDGFRCIAFRNGEKITCNRRPASRSRAIFPTSSVPSPDCPSNNLFWMANLLSPSAALFIRCIATASASGRESRPEIGQGQSSHVYRVRSPC